MSSDVHNSQQPFAQASPRAKRPNSISIPAASEQLDAIVEPPTVVKTPPSPDSAHDSEHSNSSGKSESPPATVTNEPQLTPPSPPPKPLGAILSEASREQITAELEAKLKADQAAAAAQATERQKLAEQKQQEEEAKHKQQEEAERQLKELEAQNVAKAKAESERRQQEVAQAAEAKRREDEAKQKILEEQKKRDEEARRKLEEMDKAAKAAAQAEAEHRASEEKQKHDEEERQKREEETKRAEEERQRQLQATAQPDTKQPLEKESKKPKEQQQPEITRVSGVGALVDLGLGLDYPPLPSTQINARAAALVPQPTVTPSPVTQPKSRKSAFVRFFLGFPEAWRTGGWLKRTFLVLSVILMLAGAAALATPGLQGLGLLLIIASSASIGVGGMGTLTLMGTNMPPAEEPVAAIIPQHVSPPTVQTAFQNISEIQAKQMAEKLDSDSDTVMNTLKAKNLIRFLPSTEKLKSIFSKNVRKKHEEAKFDAIANAMLVRIGQAFIKAHADLSDKLGAQPQALKDQIIVSALSYSRIDFSRAIIRIIKSQLRETGKVSQLNETIYAQIFKGQENILSNLCSQLLQPHLYQSSLASASTPAPTPIHQ